MKKEKILNYLPYAIILLIVSFFTINKYFENDIFFDIKTGESILKYGIDFKDHFSFIPGLTYIYHHWFYDLIVYFIFNLFSYKGLLLFYIIFIYILSMILFTIFNKNTKNKFISLIMTIIIVYCTKMYLTTRVQTITYPLFVLYIYFLNEFYKTDKRKYLIYMIILSLFINNMHMTMWLLMIVFMLPYIAEILIGKLKSIKKLKNIFSNIDNKIEIDKPKNIKKFLIGCLIIFLTGLITPLKLWSYKFAFVSLNSREIFLKIAEMKYTTLWLRKYTLILLIILFLYMLFTKKKIYLRDIFYFIGLFLLSLMADRNVPYFLILIPIVFSKYINFEKIKGTDFKEYKDFISISITIMLLFLAGLVSYEFITQKFDGNLEKQYPVKVTEYLKDNTDYKKIRIYNEYDFGSYLEFNDFKVLVDSRAEVYIKAFNNKEDILAELFFANNDSSIEAIIQKYKLQYLIVYKNSEIDKYLRRNADYYEELLNENNQFILYKNHLV